MIRFNLVKSDWQFCEEGYEPCFLLTNGLGGFSRLDVKGACTRGDHALFMGVQTAPNNRVHMVTNVHEMLHISGKTYELASQQYVRRARNKNGHEYIHHFNFEYIPRWYYQVSGVWIEKTLVMPHLKNRICKNIRYRESAGRRCM